MRSDRDGSAPPRRAVTRATPSDSASSAAASGDPRRNETGLAQRNGQRPERDPPGLDRQDPVPVDLDRQAIHAASGRSEAERLDPEAVIARLVTRTVEPEVLDAGVLATAEM